jgi:uncharacterized RDD family membrane protein YckC
VTAVSPLNLATWRERVGAAIIDAIPYLALLGAGAVVGNDGDGTYGVYLYLFLLAGLAWIGYNRWLLGGRGQSWGKRLLGLDLVAEGTEKPIGAGAALVRDLAHAADVVSCIGVLFPLWDAKRQTLGDKLAGTVVTKR